MVWSRNDKRIVITLCSKCIGEKEDYEKRYVIKDYFPQDRLKCETITECGKI